MWPIEEFTLKVFQNDSIDKMEAAYLVYAIITGINLCSYWIKNTFVHVIGLE